MVSFPFQETHFFRFFIFQKKYIRFSTKDERDLKTNLKNHKGLLSSSDTDHSVETMSVSTSTAEADEGATAKQRLAGQEKRVLAALIQQLRDPSRSGTAAAEVAQLLEKVQFSPLTSQMAKAMEGDAICMDVLAEVFSNQERASTIKQFAPYWKRWSEFAVAHELILLPPETGDTRSFEAGFSRFACHEYEIARKGGRLSKSQKNTPNAPGTYNQIFQGINHILTKIFNVRELKVPLIENCTTAYRLNYSRPKKKARPLLGRHLQVLVKLATKLTGPNWDWLQFVVDVVLIAWMAAGRWSCMDNINVQKSIGSDCEIMGINPDPRGEYWLLFWKERKNVDGESCTECPTIKDTKLDPRTRFMSLVGRYKRHDSKKLLPKFSKRQGVDIWDVVMDPTAYCGYHQFLQMFRAVMSLAGLDDVMDMSHAAGAETRKDWSLHGWRGGFVTEMRGQGGQASVFIETIARHGGWSYESVECILGYNSVDSREHARVLLPAIMAALTGNAAVTASERSTKRQRR